MGVRPPGPSPGDAVSIKSSKDKRPKRSPEETLTRRVEVSAPAARSARTYDVEAVKPGVVWAVREGPGHRGCRVP